MLSDQKSSSGAIPTAEGEAEAGDVAAAISNATNVLQTRNNGDIKTAAESPSEQSILELRNAQTCYRDLMQTREELFCRK